MTKDKSSGAKRPWKPGVSKALHGKLDRKVDRLNDRIKTLTKRIAVLSHGSAEEE